MRIQDSALTWSLCEQFAGLVEEHGGVEERAVHARPTSGSQLMHPVFRGWWLLPFPFRVRPVQEEDVPGGFVDPERLPISTSEDAATVPEVRGAPVGDFGARLRHVLFTATEHRYPRHIRAESLIVRACQYAVLHFGDPPKAGGSGGCGDHHDPDLARIAVEDGAQRFRVDGEGRIRARRHGLRAGGGEYRDDRNEESDESGSDHRIGSALY